MIEFFHLYVHNKTRKINHVLYILIALFVVYSYKETFRTLPTFDVCDNLCTYWMKLLLWVMNRKIAWNKNYRVFVRLLFGAWLNSLPYTTGLMKIFQLGENMTRRKKNPYLPFFCIFFIFHFDVWIPKTLNDYSELTKNIQCVQNTQISKRWIWAVDRIN